MKRNTLDYRRDGMPRIGNEEMYAFAEERYHNLLREADQYRLERQVSRPRPSASLQAGNQPLARLLRWAWIAGTVFGQSGRAKSSDFDQQL